MEGNTGKQEKIEEFRYYEMPMGRYDLSLLGDKCITHYQTNEQHFHNFFEIAYCHYGEGFVYMGEESPSYQKGSITLIPANFPHGIQSAPGRVCFWEFLYVDIMGFAKNCGDEDGWFLPSWRKTGRSGSATVKLSMAISTSCCRR